MRKKNCCIYIKYMTVHEITRYGQRVVIKIHIHKMVYIYPYIYMSCMIFHSNTPQSEITIHIFVLHVPL